MCTESWDQVLESFPMSGKYVDVLQLSALLTRFTCKLVFRLAEISKL